MDEDTLIETLTDALRHAVLWLQEAVKGEPVDEIDKGLEQVHLILANKGIKFNKSGELVPLRRIGFIQHD